MNRSAFSDLWRDIYRPLTRMYYVECTAAVMCLLLLGFLQIPAPLLTKRVLDSALTSQAHPRTIIWSCIALLIVVLGTLCLRMLHRAIMERLGALIVYHVQKRLLDKSLSLPAEYHIGRSHGYMLSRLTNDPEAMYALLTETVFGMAANGVTLLFGSCVLMYLNWPMALAVFGALLLYGLLASMLRTRTKPLYSSVHEQHAQVVSYLGSILFNVICAKMLTRRRSLLTHYMTLVNSLIKSRFALLRTRIIGESLLLTCSSVTPIVILGLGAHELIAHRLTAGGFIAFTGYLGYLYNPAEAMAIGVLGAQNALAAAERVREIVTTEDEDTLYARDIFRPPEAPAECGIEFEDVSYKYPGASEWVLNRVNCHFRAGELSLIRGASGSGKSTLINLIPLLIAPTEGDIRLAGLHFTNLKELRNQISLVSQETFLMPTTVMDNIRGGVARTTRLQAKRAAEIACADEFIERLPEGYDTKIVECGRSLSAGQRQRLLIARAVARGVQILILDEGTSCLDILTEARILAGLRQLGIRYIIVVSHRDAIRQYADRVFTVSSGRVIEECVVPTANLAHDSALTSVAGT